MVQSGFATNLWFDGTAEEAANYYVSVFPDSGIERILRYNEAGPGPAGSVVTVEFVLNGDRFVAINGGPDFTFSEAISLQVDCDDQAEVDHYWAVLTDGGEEGPCGWLKDRYGVSWQVCPVGIVDLIGDPDPVKAKRATEAMYSMRKLDLEAIRAAHAGA